MKNILLFFFYASVFQTGVFCGSNTACTDYTALFSSLSEDGINDVRRNLIATNENNPEDLLNVALDTLRLSTFMSGDDQAIFIQLYNIATQPGGNQYVQCIVSYFGL
ncbi:hypothetical protein ACKWTF_016707 [Chironomus riparius]